MSTPRLVLATSESVENAGVSPMSPFGPVSPISPISPLSPGMASRQRLSSLQERRGVPVSNPLPRLLKKPAWQLLRGVDKQYRSPTDMMMSPVSQQLSGVTHPMRQVGRMCPQLDNNGPPAPISISTTATTSRG
ncbi:hypothetical protein CLOM_g2023 [Closterium sp. NIES-68]|nr:hypothetical protein CLOM_g2023 [Closterium sp. NIES-68]GJP67478.1 hypothetical protein CLOP_g24297 [Closterium sp. NIES-67]